MKESQNKSHPEESRVAFWIWIIAALMTLTIVTVLITAGLVWHAMRNGPRLSEAQTKMVLAVAEFPSLVKQALVEISGESTTPLLIDKTATEKPYWIRKFPSHEDKGYLLFSGVDPKIKYSIIQLIRLSDGEVMAQWIPDWEAIYQKISNKKWAPKEQIKVSRAFHPVLLDNGDIIFNTFNSMVRLDLCSTEPEWVLDKVMHHSNEIALDGVSIWTPAVSDAYFADNLKLKNQLRDDSLARVSLNGQMLENRSFSKILIDNGLRELLLGTSGMSFQGDPIHINQISVAHKDTAYWMRGDLLISARHLSTVFLYRPSTGKIVWHQQGPWMNQHSARFVDDDRISVFSNNVYGGAPTSQTFVKPGDINRVFVYDFGAKRVTEPFAKLLEEAKPITMTEGRAEILPDGGLFIEESSFGRHLRFTKGQLLWSRVNDYDESRIGIVSWSRYLTQEAVKKPLAAIAARHCNKQFLIQKNEQ